MILVYLFFSIVGAALITMFSLPAFCNMCELVFFTFKYFYEETWVSSYYSLETKIQILRYRKEPVPKHLMQYLFGKLKSGGYILHFQSKYL